MNLFWSQAQRSLIAKSLAELSYEQVLHPIEVDDVGGGYKSYTLPFGTGGEYRFEAWKTVWDFLRVRPETIQRLGSFQEPSLSAAQFFIDLQSELAMDDICLGNFLEEMHTSLYGDMKILESSSQGHCEQWVRWNALQLQAVLPGHPKILLNKGRMGWGSEDLARYAPEYQPKFQLSFIAIHKSLAVTSSFTASEYETVLLQVLTSDEFENLKTKIRDAGVDEASYWILPVHPWQYQRYILVQFADWIAQCQLIPLGSGGTPFTPQISIRTLCNVMHPRNLDVKLSLSILNTSAVRGLPARAVQDSVMVAKRLQDLCSRDNELKKANTVVLCDRAGVAIEHPSFKQIPGAPYRYTESLGVIFRESVESKLQDNETAILTATLSLQDKLGDSMIGCYIRNSGLSIEQWLRRYFQVVVVPLYHLQLKHGIGIVAHGQNIVLRLQNFVPAGMFLKDFQGDLRISDQEHTAFASLPVQKLKPDYLIHDLITGHFVSVLRFASAALWESDGFSEDRFYRILNETLCDYLKRTDQHALDPALDLFAKQYKRVLLNKVRFAIGYGDSSVRPLPQLGRDLLNPLLGDWHGNV